MPLWPVLAVCLVLAVVTSAAAGVQQGSPKPLDHPVTLRCDPPLVTEIDALVPRKLIVVRAALSSQLGGVLVWTNNVSYYSFVGASSFWWSKDVCAKAVLPKSLPRAKLVRLRDVSITCVVPGRQLLVHATRRNGTNSLSLRALPHGQLLVHVQLVGKTVRAYASRYAIRRCELDA